MRTSSVYRVRQGAALWPALIVAVVFVAFVGAAIASGEGAILAFFIPILIFVGAIAWFFSVMDVELRGEILTWSFRGGFLRKSIALAEIKSVEPVRNPFWYGWGIKRTPRGWLYNVRGRGAVEIGTRGGRHVRIGADDPEALAAAIRVRLP